MARSHAPASRREIPKHSTECFNISQVPLTSRLASCVRGVRGTTIKHSIECLIITTRSPLAARLPRAGAVAEGIRTFCRMFEHHAGTPVTPRRFAGCLARPPILMLGVGPTEGGQGGGDRGAVPVESSYRPPPPAPPCRRSEKKGGRAFGGSCQSPSHWDRPGGDASFTRMGCPEPGFVRQCAGACNASVSLASRGRRDGGATNCRTEPRLCQRRR